MKAARPALLLAFVVLVQLAHVIQCHTLEEVDGLKLKELRKMLDDRGVKCVGCAEKGDFLARVKETFNEPMLTDEEKAAAKEKEEGKAKKAQAKKAAKTAKNKEEAEKKEKKEKKRGGGEKREKKEPKKKKSKFSLPDFTKMELKELTDYKWRLKDELKKVEQQFSDVKSGKSKSNEKKDDEAMPKCMQACWNGFDDCLAAEGVGKGGKPNKDEMCKCMKSFHSKSCNTCDYNTNFKHQKMCESYGCSAEECVAPPEETKDDPPPAKDAKKGAKKDGKKEYFFMSDEDLMQADVSKLRVKNLKRILEERGVKCTGCKEKEEYVKKAQQLVDKLQNDVLDGNDAGGDEEAAPTPKKEKKEKKKKKEKAKKSKDEELDDLLKNMKDIPGMGNFKTFSADDINNMNPDDLYGDMDKGGSKKKKSKKDKKDPPKEETEAEKKKRWLEEEKTKRASEPDDEARKERRRKNKEEMARKKAQREQEKLDRQREAEEAAEVVDEFIDLDSMDDDDGEEL
jgi:hypothetical protein